MSASRVDSRTGGVASGAYVVLGWPLRTAVAFLSGSYLAVVGIALALLSAGTGTALALPGVGLVGLATFALVATLRSSLEELLPARASREGDH